MLNKSGDKRRIEESARARLIATTPHLNPNAHHLRPHHVPLPSPDHVNNINRFSSSPSYAPFNNGSPFSPRYSPSPTLPLNNNDHFSSNNFCFHSNSPTFTANNWVDDDLTGLFNGFSRMNITSFVDENKTRGYHMDSYGFSSNVSGFNETGTLPFNNAASFIGKGYGFSNPLESSLAPQDHSIWNCDDQMYHQLLMDHKRKQGTSNCECDRQLLMQTPSLFNNNNNPYVCDRLGGDCEAGWSVKNPYRFSQIMHPRIAINPPNAITPSDYCPATKEMAPANTEFPPPFSPGRCGRTGMDPSVFRCDNSIILQGKDVKHCIDHGCNSLRGCTKSPSDEVAIQITGENVSKHIPHQICENNSTLAGDLPLPLLLNFRSLAEMQSIMYNMAKDQNGCRLLQKMVEEGTYEDMCMVFEGIIHNVVELMMDSFGNYLVQKLLDVCNEEQRMQILLMVTKEPGQLVRISLNAHGTRVVQKLIETLKYSKQISLVKSAIQPCFLDLTKDLNGNHVIQRCLQRFSCQDNKFIFEAAVRFCVEIATHRHGCCVLQRCIDHSVGKERDRLVAEICKHGLLLAQDPFGNYVVQYIMMMETQAVATKMIDQFRGHYVSLSTQKFSSHVVEKCLKHIGDSRSRIVRELLSAPHFGEILQDPYGNYVIQSALGVTKGSMHSSLVEAVRPYKMLKSSPYCKRIFSGNLLKK